MKLCRFNETCLGLVEGDHVYDVTAAAKAITADPWPTPYGDPLIRNIDAVCKEASRLRPNANALPLATVRLNNPVLAPTKIMAAPANYRLHLTIDAKDPGIHHGVHMDLDKIDRPVETLGMFLKASSSAVGPSEGFAIRWPDRRNDHEVELAVVIGKGGKNISRENAFDHIAGYMVGLDMTVRGKEGRSWRKSADSYTIFGPWFTTKDEIKDPENLTVWIDVNGERKQTSSTGAMIVGIAELIEFSSRTYGIHPGDIIMTGTPEGVSTVKAGDIMRCGCDGLGEMTVEVRDA
jgi:2,4-didehydro-3-deoxy-L-rhamnonate hydrolase